MPATTYSSVHFVSGQSQSQFFNLVAASLRLCDCKIAVALSLLAKCTCLIVQSNSSSLQLNSLSSHHSYPQSIKHTPTIPRYLNSNQRGKMGATYSQIFPPPPTLTESNLPSQHGKVFLITGGYSGVGFELAKILYNANGTVYVAGRDGARALAAIEKIKASFPNNSTTSDIGEDGPGGKVEFLYVDLSDLSTVKGCARTFLEKEKRLDVLWNNAGISMPPQGSMTAQGHEAMMGTNCLGPFLLTSLLLPILKSTAKSAPEAGVRVVWTSSIAVDSSAPDEGVTREEMGKFDKGMSNLRYYTASKMGNWMLASQLARREPTILSVTQNPGNLQTGLLKHRPWLVAVISPLLYAAKFGAYTEIYSGLSPELKLENNGAYIVPWGRIHPGPREALLNTLRAKEEGGTGRAEEFWEWCKEETRDYM